MTKEEAYEIVYKDLITASLFRGIYDARHGNISFMNGIACVMEVIADSAETGRVQWYFLRESLKICNKS